MIFYAPSNWISLCLRREPKHSFPDLGPVAYFNEVLAKFSELLQRGWSQARRAISWQAECVTLVCLF